MNIRNAFNAKAIARFHSEVPSNKIPFLGAVFFPAQKKAGLDLKWIKTSGGLPVSLAPSAFDAKSTIRSREGFKIDQTEMAFFRESMLVSEKDEQEIMRVQDANEPYAQDVLNHIFNDAENLVSGAAVVPERMIWQLLAPNNGTPSISISANGATYSYNYDPAGTHSTTNFHAYTGTSAWTDYDDSDPMKNISDAIDAVESNTGVRPAYIVMNKTTMTHLVKNDKIKSYILAQNPTANIFMSSERVKNAIQNELGLATIIYDKQYKAAEGGNATKFLADGMVVLLPEGGVGKTWYGTTPEERALAGTAGADVATVDTGVTVTVTTTNDPVNTKTTVSEIVLPSFEGMDTVYTIKAY